MYMEISIWYINIYIYLLRRWLQEHVATPGTSTSPDHPSSKKILPRGDQVLGFGCQSLRQYTDNDLRNFEIWCWGPDSANLGSSGSLEAALRAYDSEFFSTVEGEMCCSAYDGFFCNTLFVAFVGCWFLDRRNEFEEVLRMLVVAILNLGIHGDALPELQVWLAGTSTRALPLTWWVWEISNIARLPILEVLSSCVLEMERLGISLFPKWGCKGQRYTPRKTNMTMQKQALEDVISY